MGLLEELAKAGIGAVLEGQAKVPHDHLVDLKVFRTSGPLLCGSQYFVAFNDAYTLGFERDELIRFRDEMNDGIRKSLAATENPVSQTDNKCLVCGEPANDENGFGTPIGWIHFECKETSNAHQ